MIDRRTLLLSSAALAACSHGPPASSPASNNSGPPASSPASNNSGPLAPSPTSDTNFRGLIDRLADATPQERAAALRAIDVGTLSADDRVLHASIAAGIDADAALAAFPFGQDGRPYAVTHRAGAYRRIATDISTETAAAIDADTARVEADAARGVTPPDFILDRTLAALNAAREPLTRARGEAAVAVGGALQRQIDLFTRLRASASSAPGVSRLPNGEAYYQLVLTRALGAAASPRDAHALAQAFCERLGRDAHQVLLDIGDEAPRHRHDIGDLLARQANDPTYLYPDSSEGRARAVADMNAALAHMRTLMPRAFAADLAQTPSSVLRMSAEDEARGAAGRREGGDYIVDLTRIRTRPSWTLPSVVYHETLPGHALQARLQSEAAPPRLQISMASAYSEGWAIYAEAIAGELGAFADSHSRLGDLYWTLFRYGRALVDTGMHCMGWSRDRAVETLRSLQGFDAAFVSIEDDVDRMAVEPGAYAAQAISALEIMRERERARVRYGDRFSFARFHDAVLRRGPLSPPGIAQSVRVAFEG